MRHPIAILLLVAAPAAAQLTDARKTGTSATLVSDNGNAVAYAEHIALADDNPGDVAARLAGLVVDRELGSYDYRGSANPSDLDEGEYDIINVNSAHRTIYIDPPADKESYFASHWHVGLRFYVGGALLELAPYALAPGKSGTDWRGHYTVVSGSLPGSGATGVRVHTEGSIPSIADMDSVAFSGDYLELDNKPVIPDVGANPQGDPTGTLSTLLVGATVYKLSGAWTDVTGKPDLVEKTDLEPRDDDAWASRLAANGFLQSSSDRRAIWSVTSDTSGAPVAANGVNATESGNDWTLPLADGTTYTFLLGAIVSDDRNPTGASGFGPYKAARLASYYPSGKVLYLQSPNGHHCKLTLASGATLVGSGNAAYFYFQAAVSAKTGDLGRTVDELDWWTWSDYEPSSLNVALPARDIVDGDTRWARHDLSNVSGVATAATLTQATGILVEGEGGAVQTASIAHMNEHVLPERTAPKKLSATYETGTVSAGDGKIKLVFTPGTDHAQATWGIRASEALTGGGSIPRADIEDVLTYHHTFTMQNGDGSKAVTGPITGYGGGGAYPYQVSAILAQTGSAFTDGEDVTVKLQSALVDRDEFTDAADYAGDDPDSFKLLTTDLEAATNDRVQVVWEWDTLKNNSTTIPADTIVSYDERLYVVKTGIAADATTVRGTTPDDTSISSYFEPTHLNYVEQTYPGSTATYEFGVKNNQDRRETRVFLVWDVNNDKAQSGLLMDEDDGISVLVATNAGNGIDIDDSTSYTAHGFLDWDKINNALSLASGLADDELPAAPATNGTYKLRGVKTNGGFTLSWVDDS